jgi:hypothetical protein
MTPAGVWRAATVAEAGAAGSGAGVVVVGAGCVVEVVEAVVTVGSGTRASSWAPDEQAATSRRKGTIRRSTDPSLRQ